MGPSVVRRQTRKTGFVVDNYGEPPGRIGDDNIWEAIATRLEAIASLNSLQEVSGSAASKLLVELLCFWRSKRNHIGHL